MGGADNLAAKAPKFFVELGERFKNLGLGVIDIGKGLGEELEGVIIGSISLIDDMIDLSITSFMFAGSNTICAIYFLTNLKDCFIYYILQMIGTLLYLPVIIIVWILKTFKIIDLQTYLDKFWVFMEKVDRIVYKKCKFHIIHFQKSIREKCFVCKRLKASVIADLGGKIVQDFTPPDGEVVKPFAKGIEDIIKGGEELGSVFAPW